MGVFSAFQSVAQLVSVHKRASKPVYGIAAQKHGFASLSFSMTYVIQNGGTSMCRISLHPYPDAH